MCVQKVFSEIPAGNWLMLIFELYEALKFITLYNLLVCNWAIFCSTNLVDKISPQKLANWSSSCVRNQLNVFCFYCVFGKYFLSRIENIVSSKPKFMPSQVRFLVGYQTDFYWLITKRNCIRIFFLQILKLHRPFEM